MNGQDTKSRIDRARAYVAKLPPAVSGEHGHNATFVAAIAVAHGFGLSEDDAVRVLLDDFNPTCQPPWDEAELRHKVRDAIGAKHDKPRGHLFDGGRPEPKTGMPDWPQKAKECAASWCTAGLEIAAKLGLPADALRRVELLGASQWNRIGGVVTWAEHDGSGKVIGVAYRTLAGEKKALKGSKRGIALSADWRTVREGYPLVVAEGMSDLAAVAHAGFPAVARPSKAMKATTAATMLAGLIDTTDHKDILIVADLDDAGEEGNAAAVTCLLAAKLPGWTVRWAGPPDGAKDCRAWLIGRPESEEWADRGRAFLAALESRKPPAEPPPSTERPVSFGDRRQVEITTEEHRVNSEVTTELVKDQSLYQRNGELVRIIVVAPEQDGPRVSVVPRIEVIPVPALRDLISRWVEFFQLKQTENGEEYKQKHPPAWCVNAVAARGRWPGVRHLVGVVSFPALRPDGSILTSPGYDPATGLFLHWQHGPIQVAERPGQGDARRAADELLDVVADFPFQADMHRAAWLAGLLTPLARAAFDGPAPLFLVDANVRAAGKGMLLEVISRVVTGNPFPVISYPSGSKDGEEELRKKITTFLMYGDRLALFDNLTGGFGDGTLDRCLTSTEWQDRQLGANRQYRGPVDVSFFATGNNVAVRADTARRVCHVRLESQDERPEERGDFKRPNLIAWVTENRERLLALALTILRAYYLAGRPDQGLKPWGSFESWSRLIRNAVVWCGLPDPGETRQVIQEQADETGQGLRLFMAALEQMDREGKGLTAGEIVGATDEDSPYSEAVKTTLSAALDTLIAKRDSRKLGYRLRGLRRRVMDGKFLDLTGKDENYVNRWVVVEKARFHAGREPCPPCAPCPGTQPGHGAHEGHLSPRHEKNGTACTADIQGRLYREDQRLPD